MFFIELFQNNLKTNRLGKKVIYHDRTESTNNDIWKLFKKGEKEGILVIANNQTRGRGRGGKTWYSNKGLDIICSFLLAIALTELLSYAIWLEIIPPFKNAVVDKIKTILILE